MLAWAGVVIRVIAAIAEKSFMLFIQWIDLARLCQSSMARSKFSPVINFVAMAATKPWVALGRQRCLDLCHLW